PLPSPLSCHVTASPESYTLSLHDALPIWAQRCGKRRHRDLIAAGQAAPALDAHRAGNDGGYISDCICPGLVGSSWQRGMGKYNQDRKSTRLNSSHVSISYDVFCLTKKTR